MGKFSLVLGAALALAGCASGRYEPQGSFTDPVCLRDGSVAFYQEAADDGTYHEPKAKKEYCPWYKKPGVH